MLNALYCTRLRFEILKFPFGIKLPDSVSYSNSNNISWIYITTEKQNLTIFRSSVKQETGRFFNIDIPWIHFGNLFLYFQKKKKKPVHEEWNLKEREQKHVSQDLAPEFQTQGNIQLSPKRAPDVTATSTALLSLVRFPSPAASCRP